LRLVSTARAILDSRNIQLQRTPFGRMQLALNGASPRDVGVPYAGDVDKAFDDVAKLTKIPPEDLTQEQINDLAWAHAVLSAVYEMRGGFYYQDAYWKYPEEKKKEWEDKFKPEMRKAERAVLKHFISRVGATADPKSEGFKVAVNGITREATTAKGALNGAFGRKYALSVAFGMAGIEADGMKIQWDRVVFTKVDASTDGHDTKGFFQQGSLASKRFPKFFNKSNGVALKPVIALTEGQFLPGTAVHEFTHLRSSNSEISALKDRKSFTQGRKAWTGLTCKITADATGIHFESTVLRKASAAMNFFSRVFANDPRIAELFWYPMQSDPDSWRFWEDEAGGGKSLEGLGVDAMIISKAEKLAYAGKSDEALELLNTDKVFRGMKREHISENLVEEVLAQAVCYYKTDALFRNWLEEQAKSDEGAREFLNEIKVFLGPSRNRQVSANSARDLQEAEDTYKTQGKAGAVYIRPQKGRTDNENEVSAQDNTERAGGSGRRPQTSEPARDGVGDSEHLAAQQNDRSDSAGREGRGNGIPENEGGSAEEAEAKRLEKKWIQRRRWQTNHPGAKNCPADAAPGKYGIPTAEAVISRMGVAEKLLKKAPESLSRKDLGDIIDAYCHISVFLDTLGWVPSFYPHVYQGTVLSPKEPDKKGKNKKQLLREKNKREYYERKAYLLSDKIEQHLVKYWAKKVGADGKSPREYYTVKGLDRPLATVRQVFDGIYGADYRQTLACALSAFEARGITFDLSRVSFSPLRSTGTTAGAWGQLLVTDEDIAKFPKELKVIKGVERIPTFNLKLLSGGFDTAVHELAHALDTPSLVLGYWATRAAQGEVGSTIYNTYNTYRTEHDKEFLESRKKEWKGFTFSGKLVDEGKGIVGYHYYGDVEEDASPALKYLMSIKDSYYNKDIFSYPMQFCNSYLVASFWSKGLIPSDLYYSCKDSLKSGDPAKIQQASEKLTEMLRAADLYYVDARRVAGGELIAQLVSYYITDPIFANQLNYDCDVNMNPNAAALRRELEEFLSVERRKANQAEDAEKAQFAEDTYNNQLMLRNTVGDLNSKIKILKEGVYIRPKLTEDPRGGLNEEKAGKAGSQTDTSTALRNNGEENAREESIHVDNSEPSENPAEKREVARIQRQRKRPNRGSVLEVGAYVPFDFAPGKSGVPTVEAIKKSLTVFDRLKDKKPEDYTQSDLADLIESYTNLDAYGSFAYGPSFVSEWYRVYDGTEVDKKLYEQKAEELLDKIEDQLLARYAKRYPDKNEEGRFDKLAVTLHKMFVDSQNDLIKGEFTAKNHTFNRMFTIGAVLNRQVHGENYSRTVALALAAYESYGITFDVERVAFSDVNCIQSGLGMLGFFDTLQPQARSVFLKTPADLKRLPGIQESPILGFTKDATTIEVGCHEFGHLLSQPSSVKGFWKKKDPDEKYPQPKFRKGSSHDRTFTETPAWDGLKTTGTWDGETYKYHASWMDVTDPNSAQAFLKVIRANRLFSDLFDYPLEYCSSVTKAELKEKAGFTDKDFAEIKRIGETSNKFSAEVTALEQMIEDKGYILPRIVIGDEVICQAAAHYMTKAMFRNWLNEECDAEKLPCAIAFRNEIRRFLDKTRVASLRAEDAEQAKYAEEYYNKWGKVPLMNQTGGYIRADKGTVNGRSEEKGNEQADSERRSTGGILRENSGEESQLSDVRRPRLSIQKQRSRTSEEELDAIAKAQGIPNPNKGEEPGWTIDENGFRTVDYDIIQPPQTAYHFSPANFSRFSLNFNLTGQGAASWGSGLYFAMEEDTQWKYATDLGGSRDDDLLFKGLEGIAVNGKPDKRIRDYYSVSPKALYWALSNMEPHHIDLRTATEAEKKEFEKLLLKAQLEWTCKDNDLVDDEDWVAGRRNGYKSRYDYALAEARKAVSINKSLITLYTKQAEVKKARGEDTSWEEDGIKIEKRRLRRDQGHLLWVRSLSNDAREKVQYFMRIMKGEAVGTISSRYYLQEKKGTRFTVALPNESQMLDFDYGLNEGTNRTLLPKVLKAVKSLVDNAETTPLRRLLRKTFSCVYSYVTRTDYPMSSRYETRLYDHFEAQSTVVSAEGGVNRLKVYLFL
jgi:hypothetical protein